MRAVGWRLLLAWCLAASAAAPETRAQTQPEPRIALVVGNANYADQKLRNPANDAKAMAASLRRLGFTVIERIDAGKKAMEDAALEFGEKLKAGGVGLFYYAGHGVQTRGRNYLVPVDAAITSEASVRVQAFDVGLVLDLMTDSRNRANVVILDACRNNPFRGVMRGASPGLAAIDAARGTLIAYSTAPGAVAVDGDGTNSPYTAALVKALAEPGMKAEDLFKRVRSRVVEVTQGAQTPWESSSLTGDLVLNLTINVTPQAASAAAPGGARDAVEVAFWQSIADSKDPQDYRDYLAQFPNGAFVPLARRRAESLGGAQQAALPSATAPATAAEKPPLEPLDKELVATQNARVREAPGLSGKQIASLAAGQSVKALGKVKDQSWFLVERADGTTGYVSASLLEDAAAWRARTEEAERRRQQAAATPAAPPAPAPAPV
ncbi:MAG: caspase family protein, partial [Alphaproteobacteria bacterium]|nr:caspase family protein [Alphaproteobacteria bacterium]